MYKKFFGLKENPFSVTPDPKFVYFSRQHEEALEHVLYGIRERKGFIAVTGEVGSGKTTLCRTLFSRLDARTRTAYLFNPDLSGAQILRAIVADLGLDASGQTKKELLDTLNAFLIRQLAEGNNVVVILDEAQGLGKKQLEQIRLLSNLETDTDKLIQILLVGQPELDVKLDDPSMRQLKQRIAVRYHIEPLSNVEIPRYIEHRLTVAGCTDRPFFTDEAMDVIYRFSGGVPRLLNVVCDRILLHAFVCETRIISVTMAEQAVDEIKGKRQDRKTEIERVAI